MCGGASRFAIGRGWKPSCARVMRASPPSIGACRRMCPAPNDIYARFHAYNSLYSNIVFCTQICHIRTMSCVEGLRACAVVQRHPSRPVTDTGRLTLKECQRRSMVSYSTRALQDRRGHGMDAHEPVNILMVDDQPGKL